MSLIALFVTQHYFFLHSTLPEFENSVFLAHIEAYVVSIGFRVRTLKSDIIRLRYELFNAHGHSCLSLPYLSHNINFFFIAHSLSFRIQFFLAHIEAYIVSFDSRVWTLKSNIIQPRYELFNAHGHSCLSLPYLSHNITFFFIAHSLSFRIQFFLAHREAYVVSFDSRVWTLKSDIIRPRYEPFNAHGHSCLSLP